LNEIHVRPISIRWRVKVVVAVDDGERIPDVRKCDKIYL